MRAWLFLIAVFFCAPIFAEENVVNVYVWSQELSNDIVEQFQKETGIKVNYSTVDSNEVMYAKLKASSTAQYDVVEPSSYYITRMVREGMIEKIDLDALPDYKNIDAAFTHPAYDPTGQYSIPWVWGLTGIFINRKYFPDDNITQWSDLWSVRYRDSLLMLDDPREAFNIGLMALHFSPNDEDLEDLEKAYQRLTTLAPNIRVYNSNSVASMIIDEDITIGIAWNADVFKAAMENPNIEFIFPKDHVVMWVDAFVIPKGAPHRDNAYKFLNFILKAKIAALQMTKTYYTTANREAIAYVPLEIANSKIIFPDEEVIRHGFFQTDVNDKALEAISRYWQLLKLQ